MFVVVPGFKGNLSLVDIVLLFCRGFSKLIVIAHQSTPSCPGKTKHTGNQVPLIQSHGHGPSCPFVASTHWLHRNSTATSPRVVGQVQVVELSVARRACKPVQFGLCILNVQVVSFVVFRLFSACQMSKANQKRMDEN